MGIEMLLLQTRSEHRFARLIDQTPGFRVLGFRVQGFGFRV